MEKAHRQSLTRKQKRKIVIAVLLALVLALLAAYYLYYRSTKQLSLDIAPRAEEYVAPPEYLYSFNSGPGFRLQRPIGILVDGEDVFVIDSARHQIDVFDEDGEYKRSFGTSDTVVPLYLAKHPKTGDLYVSDRRARTIHIFTRAGAYKGEFDPNLPDEQLPDFDTAGHQWAPVALAFGPDGTFYVTEILNGHRLLIFGPDGAFRRSVGTVGIVTDASQGPEVFQFPNGVVVHDGQVYVTDSNNRRVQVFKPDGTYVRIIPTQGLPRGMSFLKPFASDDASTPARFVVVDTLAHDGTLWSVDGKKLVSFGEQGILEGQFSYPNGVSTGARNKMFVADTANGRVQVWGWPEQVSAVPVPRIPRTWWPCLLPFLLLPLLLMLRKKEYFASKDFVLALVEAEEADLMPHRRRKWIVTAADYEALKDITQRDVDMSQLLHPVEHSEADAKSLMERMEIPEDQAIVISIAQRAAVFATEDRELRRIARVLEIDVVDRVEFIERFTNRVKSE